MSYRVVNISKPKKNIFDLSDGCMRDAVMSAGFYLVLDDIQKQDRTQNCYLKLYDILLNAAAKANYKNEFTIWGCYFATYEGITYGVFITPQSGIQYYSKVVNEIQKIAFTRDLTRNMEMPDAAEPLLTKKNPNIIIRYWDNNFSIPNFYRQVTELPRDKFSYVTKLQEKPEQYQTLIVDNKEIQIENVIFGLAN